MVQNLNTWLTAMPAEGEVDERIAALEREIELLRTVKRLRALSPTPDGDEPAVDESAQNGHVSLEVLRKRLSSERVQILRAIVAHPNRRASIPEVAKSTEGNRKNVGSNMQRMVSAELLVRLDRGLYALTPGAEALMREKGESHVMS